ncbi:MAG: polyphosphate kinase 2, partial [Chitinophagales bacterium]
GLRTLFRDNEINVGKALNYLKYEQELELLQTELVQLQNTIQKKGRRLIIIFEGRDSAGKGGSIKRFTEHLSPRAMNVVALSKPSQQEVGQWYFQRYTNNLPNAGEIVLFDRSWYNRAVVEPVNNFCTEKEYKIFMSQVNNFEKMLIQSDTYLIKLYFSISKEEQAKRFKEIKNSPLKRWKMTAVDEKAQSLWDEYTSYKEKMFEITNTENAPWTIIDANKKPIARLKVIEHVLESIPYE